MEKTGSIKMKVGILVGGVLVTFFILFSLGMAQQPYPSSDVDFICGHEAGGGFDITARMMAPYFAKHIRSVSAGAKGGELKIKNMVGGSGGKALTYLFKEAKADGYTIGDFNLGDLYLFQYGSEKLPFDIMKFTWLFTSNVAQRGVIVGKKGPNTWEELLALSKKEPLRWAVSSFGSTQHIEAIYMKETLGIPAKFLITGGTAPQSGAIVRGDADMAYLSYDGVSGLIASKEVKLLLTFTEKRTFPDVPTIGEKGHPEVLKVIGGYRGVIGGPNMDPEAKRILIATGRRVVADPEFRAASEKMKFVIDPPLFDKEFEAFVTELSKLYRGYGPMFDKYLK